MAEYWELSLKFGGRWAILRYSNQIKQRQEALRRVLLVLSHNRKWRWWLTCCEAYHHQKRTLSVDRTVRFFLLESVMPTFFRSRAKISKYFLLIEAFDPQIDQLHKAKSWKMRWIINVEKCGILNNQINFVECINIDVVLILWYILYN